MSGIYIQWHIVGNVLHNIYERFFYYRHVFTLF